MRLTANAEGRLRGHTRDNANQSRMATARSRAVAHQTPTNDGGAIAPTFGRESKTIAMDNCETPLPIIARYRELDPTLEPWAAKNTDYRSPRDIGARKSVPMTVVDEFGRHLPIVRVTRS